MRETLTLLLASNKGADQPAHPRSLISAFVTPYLKSKVTIFLHFCGLQHDKASGYAPVEKVITFVFCFMIAMSLLVTYSFRTFLRHPCEVRSIVLLQLFSCHPSEHLE